jgi:hypothetical protein
MKTNAIENHRTLGYCTTKILFGFTASVVWDVYTNCGLEVFDFGSKSSGL